MLNGGEKSPTSQGKAGLNAQSHEATDFAPKRAHQAT
jgi:hypothetical protein